MKIDNCPQCGIADLNLEDWSNDKFVATCNNENCRWMLITTGMAVPLTEYILIDEFSIVHDYKLNITTIQLDPKDEYISTEINGKLPNFPKTSLKELNNALKYMSF